MSDYVRRLRQTLNSEEARDARESRRAQRLAQFEGLQDALMDRQALRWDVERDSSSRKIEGHPGAAASLFVSETLGELEIQGTLRCQYAGMVREAGRGAHDITEGTIMVSVELKPLDGMTQLVDVPVHVKSGRMEQPGVLYWSGRPYVISQSAIDEVIMTGVFDEEAPTDRRNMFSPPPTSPKR